MSRIKKNIYLCNSKNKRCRVLLVGQVTTLSLSKQGFESPTRYLEKDCQKQSFFYFTTPTTYNRKNVNYTNN